MKDKEIIVKDNKLKILNIEVTRWRVTILYQDGGAIDNMTFTPDILTDRLLEADVIQGLDKNTGLADSTIILKRNQEECDPEENERPYRFEFPLNYYLRNMFGKKEAEGIVRLALKEKVA